MKKWTKEERYRVLKSAAEIRPLHERTVLSDHRQHYHIQSVTGLLNDPNGFVFHDGVWHLFYQWCPWGAVHGLKYWYHTVSKDLVTWKNKGVCIRPDTEFDNKGAYSGSALPTKDSVYLFYTGNHRDEKILHPARRADKGQARLHHRLSIRLSHQGLALCGSAEGARL